MGILKVIKALWLTVLLILAASLLLLLSDWEQRRSHKPETRKEYPSIAIMQITTTLLLDNHVAGIVDRLTELGHLAPDRHNLRHFNALGDLSMGNTIAREMVNGPYDLIITSSTVALQIFAKTNQEGRKKHVFGGVTDPYGAGVGITGKNPADHPPHMAGIGTFQPVRRTFRILKELHPGIRRVGVVWNPGEQCSDACLREAREICRELGIELVEAVATNTSEVQEATRSLLSKRVEAIWIGGDTVATSSAGMIISLAKQAGIPVFTNDPEDARSGALFGLGANYYTVGVLTANLAAEILNGKSPAEIPIENVIPEQFRLNTEVLDRLGKPWAISKTVREIMDSQEETKPLPGHSQATTPTGTGDQKSTGKSLSKIRIVQYSETEFAEQCYRGIRDGISAAGLAEGQDYELKSYNAQGDMSTLSSIMSSVKSDRVDILLTISTPALQAALRQAGDHTPVVFTAVADGVRAGAGKSETDHMPNVTGITTRSYFEGMAQLIRETLPSAKKVGTLFTPGEINSILYKDWFLEGLRKEGLELVVIPVNSSSEVPQATTELFRNDIQVLCQIVDNLIRPGFPVMARKAADNHIPVYVFDSSQMQYGGALCISCDFYDAGVEAAAKAVRILKGESPATIPFNNTQSRKLMYNPELIARYGIKLSPGFTEKAERYIQP